AIHRRDREELHRLRVAVHPVLDVGPADRRGALGPQGEVAVAAVPELVHLLLHDIRALPRRALEERGVLEDGRHDLPVAVQGGEPLGLAHDPRPVRPLLVEDVVRPRWGLELRHARSSARNGLRASSAPSVVSGPWPGYTTVSAP